MKKIHALPPNANMAIIKQKMPEKKLLVVGLVLCTVLVVLILYLTQSVTSISAELTKRGEAIYSPVDGIVYEVLVKKGQAVRKGDALVHLDPAYIRSKTAEIRLYLQKFKDNQHNPGTLKQIFKPVLGEAFSEISEEVARLSKQEVKKLEELQEITREHVRVQVQMRSKLHYVDGKPDPKLVEQEADLQKQVEKAEKEFQEASSLRAMADKKYRDLTNSLGHPNSILYRYLEEEYNKTQVLQQHEFMYAPFNATVGEISVNNASMVQAHEILMEIHPEQAQEWWVRAVFSHEDAKKLRERDICTVILENGNELDARIFAIQPKEKDTVVKLSLMEIPENIRASEFVKVESQ